MTADKTLTKEEFAEKYAPRRNAPISHAYEPIPEFLSDLNALLREELIKYEDWSHRHFFSATSSEDEIKSYVRQIDEFLNDNKSQQ
jgi:hypothetical protein